MLQYDDMLFRVLIMPVQIYDPQHGRTMHCTLGKLYLEDTNLTMFKSSSQYPGCQLGYNGYTQFFDLEKKKRKLNEIIVSKIGF